MDTSSFMLEDIHFPQQSRRDKLRTHHDYNDAHSNNMNNHHLQPGTICYDPSGFCSEISNFSEKHENFNHPSDTVMINRDPQQSYFSTWKSIGSQPASTADSNFWVAVDQTPNFVGQGVSGNSDSSNNNNNNNRTMPTFDVKPYSNLGYQDHLHSHLGSEISGHKQYGDEHMHCVSGSASFYHNALQELVSTSGVRSFVPASSLRQKSSEGELLLLPAYGDQLGLRGSNDLISRPVEGRQWNNTLDFAAVKENTYANTQALSLSLSSVPSPKVHATQVAERSNAMDLCETRDFSGNPDHVQDFRTWKPEHLPNLAMTGSKVFGDDRQDMMGSRVLTAHRNHGPLGPFTGYATVLRNSKFLRPAQILLEELLEELCGVARPYNKDIGICEEPRDKILEEIRVSGEAVSNRETGTKVIAVDPSGSLFGFNGPDDKNPESGGGGGWMESYRPENHQKKAKLLCMQDEVCKKYKQYHQQMQMVVSSFESVAGLSVAAPYVSLALKMVSKHFRFLKNAIMDQIKSIRNALGEELSSPLAGTSNAGVPMLKFFDQSFQRQRGASGLGILEGQHIWRPQRGLPERAVSILRAWLFDHFLHPYPTDADKHMLAAQTGLTRNQVSNWFINARVRVWKPMVEEIHMLETKGTADTELNVKTTPTDCDQTNSTAGQCSSNTYRTSKMLADSYSSLDPSQPSPGNRLNASASWNNQEKRSRIEYHHVPTSLIGGPVMGFQGIGVEVAGPSAVSLTLGLRQSAENNGQRPHYGGQIIGDFVG